MRATNGRRAGDEFPGISQRTVLEAMGRVQALRREDRHYEAVWNAAIEAAHAALIDVFTTPETCDPLNGVHADPHVCGLRDREEDA